ncbi:MULTISPECIES: hypothetical protein [unclassified Halomonas]|uniref:hypothetical protein n=1 Tax=unclassified Halomonas TaxID=2609666 RepID=UPI003CF48ABE
MPKEVYKTVSVRADMGDIKKKVTKQRQVGTRTVTKTKGILKKETYEVEEPIYEQYDEFVSTGERSDTFIDIEGFSKKIMDACNALANDGYEVVHISDVIDGRYHWQKWEGQNKHGSFGQNGTTWGAGWGYGYGYSVTDGVVITAKLKNV